jgi:tetratricopeptide (TPR) repeat protein
MRGLRRRASIAVGCLLMATPAVPVARAQEAPAVQLHLVRQARALETVGEFAKALVPWRELRVLVPRDADLELAIACDEARAGMLEAAATRLASPLLSRAAMDTVPADRFRRYTSQREDDLYVNNAFDGWHWYVWRARAEVAAARGRWADATAAARRSVAARPMSGKEWLLLAVCAGRAGLADEARTAAQRAAMLDPGLPEAQYVAGLWAWKGGRREEAQDRFRAASTLDSTYQAPALALVRSNVSGSAPDSLPVAILTGIRAIGLLTSPAGPKLETYVPPPPAAIIARKVDPAVPDSLKARLATERLGFWLLVDERGRVVLHELTWFPADRYPASLVGELAAKLAAWRFVPMVLEDQPRKMWVDVQYAFQF